MGLPLWDVKPIECPLTYLRLPAQNITRLCKIMSLEKLSTTLEHLHVAMRSLDQGILNDLPEELSLCKMIHLRSFSLVQTVFTRNIIEWSTIEYLTSPNVMPVLRKMKLILLITKDDLPYMNRSAVFTDNRQVDVQFIFFMDSVRAVTRFSKQIPHGSHFHPRQIIGVTYAVKKWKLKYRHSTNLKSYVSSIP